MNRLLAATLSGTLALAAFLLFMTGAAAQPRAPRQIAITFDDLPAVPTYDVPQMRALTTKLLKTLKRRQVPVIPHNIQLHNCS